MSFARRTISSKQLLRSASVARAVQPRVWSLVTKRGYASGGDHGEEKPSSDLPWAIPSAIVTVVGGGYLWSIGPKADDGHHGDHGEHGEHGEEHAEEDSHDAEESKEGKEKKEEKAADEDDSAKDDSESKDESTEDKSDSDSGSEDGGKETPDTSDDEGDAERNGSEEVGGKPYNHLAPDKINNQGAMGYKEKVGQTEGEGPKAATGAMHRARPHDDKSLSTKGEGLHDTARISEPVDPHRPAK